MRTYERVSLDSGPDVLGAAFETVEVVRFPSRLLVPTPEPIVDYIESLTGWEGPDAEERTHAVRARVAAAIAERGVFEVHTCPGVLVCR